MKKPSYERQNQWVTDYIYPVLGNEGGVRQSLQNYQRNNGERLRDTAKRLCKAGKDAVVETRNFLTRKRYNKPIDATIGFMENAASLAYKTALVGVTVYVISGGEPFGVDLNPKDYAPVQIESQVDEEVRKAVEGYREKFKELYDVKRLEKVKEYKWLEAAR